jgi:hypothetical protein
MNDSIATMFNTNNELSKNDNLNQLSCLTKSDNNSIQLKSQFPNSKLVSTDVEFQELRQIKKLYENLSLAQKKKFIAYFIYT